MFYNRGLYVRLKKAFKEVFTEVSYDRSSPLEYILFEIPMDCNGFIGSAMKVRITSDLEYFDESGYRFADSCVFWINWFLESVFRVVEAQFSFSLEYIVRLFVDDPLSFSENYFSYSEFGLSYGKK